MLAGEGAFDNERSGELFRLNFPLYDGTVIGGELHSRAV